MNNVNLWTNVKKILSKNKEIDNDIYNCYISNSNLYIHNDTYIIVVKEKFALKIVKQLNEHIQNAISNLIGTMVLLEIKTESEYNEYKKINKDGIKKESNNQLISTKETFDNFIIGNSNKLAYNALVDINIRLGKFTPIYIFGDSGLGKTHLLKATYNKLVTSDQNLKICYISGSDFTKRAIDVLTKYHNEIENFKKEFTDYDVLIMDDIQFLSNKEKTNEIFFAIINNFIDNEKQLIFSCDKAPDYLTGFDKRFISRFNLGLIILIQKLDIDTTTKIIEYVVKEQNPKLMLNNDALSYIATHYSDDVRKIKGCILKIDFWASQNTDISTNDTISITLNEIQEIFKYTPPSNVGILNIKKIKEVVAEKFGLKIEALEGKARSKEIISARHLAMYLEKKIFNHSLNQIGLNFGNRNHTTVINAINNIETKIEKDNNFKKIVDSLINKITIRK